MKPPILYIDQQLAVWSLFIYTVLPFKKDNESRTQTIYKQQNDAVFTELHRFYIYIFTINCTKTSIKTENPHPEWFADNA